MKAPTHPLGWMMRLVSSVTAAVRASALPLRVAPVCIWMLASAMMLPTKVVETAIVAELPTTQKMSHGCAPLISDTRAPVAVTRVLPILKMYMPPPLSVSVPVKVGAVLWL